MPEVSRTKSRLQKKLKRVFQACSFTCFFMNDRSFLYNYLGSQKNAVVEISNV